MSDRAEVEIEVRGERFTLLPEGALYWPREGWLVIADLHLGKAETFGESGMYLPPEAQHADLARIAAAARRVRAREILFLGDLVHARIGVTAELRARFGAWLGEFPGTVRMLVGNHDVGTVKRWPPEWASVSFALGEEEIRVGGFSFRHEPPSEGELARGSIDDAFVWAGHVHPCARLEFGPDRFRLPAFVVRERYGLLPAFSSLAGGHEIRRGNGTRLFPTDGERVYIL